MVGEAKKALQKDLEKEKSSREGADKSSLRQEMLDSIVPWAINRHDSKEDVIPHALTSPISKLLSSLWSSFHRAASLLLLKPFAIILTIQNKTTFERTTF